MKWLPCSIVVLLIRLSAFASAPAEESPALPERLAPFEARGPTVSASYDIAYRFLGLQLMNIAEGHIELTEGVWRHRISGDEMPAVLVEIRFDSRDNPGRGRRDRISIHNRMVSVMAMPGFDTLIYVRETDEMLNPVWGSKSRSHFAEAYDLQSGELEFCRNDFVSGQMSTNLGGTNFDHNDQGREVAKLLAGMSEAFHGRIPLLGPDSGFPLLVNVGNVLTPFVVTTRLHESPSVLRKNFPALRVDVRPTAGYGRPAVLWATSLVELANRVGSDELIEAACDGRQWAMVPLIADYPLALGAVRVRMNGITLKPRAVVSNDWKNSAAVFQPLEN